MSIAPDLDKLMWNIADSGEMAAAESFQKRFPELKHELAKRLHLVQDIKKAKGLHSAVPARPEFQLRVSKPYRPSGRMIAVTAGVLGAAAVFAAAYAIFRHPSLQDIPRDPHYFVTTPCLPSAATSADAGVAKLVPQASKAKEDNFSNSVAHLNNDRGVRFPGSDGMAAPTLQAPKPPRVILKDVPLDTALHAISAQFGIKIDTAPGFPNPTVSIDLSDKDAVSALRDIGSRYDFGVVEEGEKSVLLVPQSKR